jgi:hypothetical protein
VAESPKIIDYSVVAVDGNGGSYSLYFIGGRRYDDASRSFIPTNYARKFRPGAADSYEPLDEPTYMQDERADALVAVANGVIYVAGGTDRYGKALRSVETLNTTNRNARWEYIASMCELAQSPKLSWHSFDMRLLVSLAPSRLASNRLVAQIAGRMRVSA